MFTQNKKTKHLLDARMLESRTGIRLEAVWRKLLPVPSLKARASMLTDWGFGCVSCKNNKSAHLKRCAKIRQNLSKLRQKTCQNPSKSKINEFPETWVVKLPWPSGTRHHTFAGMICQGTHVACLVFRFGRAISPNLCL